jgi:hypothetical protein
MSELLRPYLAVHHGVTLLHTVGSAADANHT